MEEASTQYEQVKSQLEKLQNVNRRLSEQVKRLTKTEHELYKSQEQLDIQIRLYQQLHEASKKFNPTFDLVEISQMATQFVLYELKFERCLVLLRSENAKDLRVQALDGYYDEDARQGVAQLTLSLEDHALLPLRSGSEQVICPAECKQEPLLALGRSVWLNMSSFPWAESRKILSGCWWLETRPIICPPIPVSSRIASSWLAWPTWPAWSRPPSIT